MSGRVIGLAVGLALAIVWIVLGFPEMLLAALGGLVGYLVAGALTRELDLADLSRRLGSRR